jgi:hypothetical protein
MFSLNETCIHKKCFNLNIYVVENVLRKHYRVIKILRFKEMVVYFYDL